MIRTLFHADLYHVVQWFILYSFLGWLVESIYMSLCNRRWTNRGFAFGPFCPIYACGALLVYSTLYRFRDRYLLVYLVGCLIATGFEYMVAILMQHLFGEVWWDYNEKPCNYRGILCLESTLAWGFYCVFMFAFLHKFVNYLSNLYSYSTGIIGAKLIVSWYLIDFMVHVYRAKREVFEPKVTKLKEALRSRI